MGRYAPEVQKLGESDLFTPMTTGPTPTGGECTGASVETSTTSELQAELIGQGGRHADVDADIFVEEEGWPGQRSVVCADADAQVMPSTMTGLLTEGVAFGGGIRFLLLLATGGKQQHGGAADGAAAQHAAKRLRASCSDFHLVHVKNKLLPTDLVFDPTLAHRAGCATFPSRWYAACIKRRGCVLPQDTLSALRCAAGLPWILSTASAMD